MHIPLEKSASFVFPGLDWFPDFSSLSNRKASAKLSAIRRSQDIDRTNRGSTDSYARSLTSRILIYPKDWRVESEARASPFARVVAMEPAGYHCKGIFSGACESLRCKILFKVVMGLLQAVEKLLRNESAALPLVRNLNVPNGAPQLLARKSFASRLPAVALQRAGSTSS